MSKWRFSTFLLAAAVAAVSLIQADMASAQNSTWEQIKSSGKVRMGVFDYPPYYVRDTATNEWHGALVEMGKDIAKELGVDFEPVIVGGWGEVVLSIQSNKIDMHPGLQATPKRATAIDFAGPIYWIEWVTVNKKGFGAKTWEDYNSPDVKIGVMSGSSDELVLRKMAPKATRVDMKELSQIVLATTAGRVDAFSTTVLSSMIAKSKNPDLGDFVNPTPRIAMPGYFGLRLEDDTRFQRFVNRWAEWNNTLGHNETRMREAMLKYSGITEIPESVSFSPN